MSKSRYDEMREAALKFHNENPEFWDLFQKFTYELIYRGAKNYSVNGVFERIRWETGFDENGVSKFKVNNNHRPFYARAFMEKYPNHKGFFRVRKQTSKDEPATGLPPLGPDFFD